jgi:glycosyltransferase involved in cell wall biosynthesis
MHDHTFTVFTPTFNRARTLNRVYESLKAQTFHDFEWLVVDDGSSDNTASLIESWKEEAPFSIRYIWQRNQGKHVAHNRGVQEARGELFLPLDSDDSCVPQSLERFKFHWDSIPSEVKPSFSAVTVLCMNQRGDLIGNRFPKNITDSDSIEIKHKYKVKGDKWGFHKTEVLRKFPFPSVNDTHVPESVVWSMIAGSYKTRYVNEVLHIYWDSEDDNAGQITKIKDPYRNAVGFAYWHGSVLNNEVAWLWTDPLSFLRSAIQYIRFSSHAGRTISKQHRNLGNNRARSLWVLALPIGLLVCLIDRTLKRRHEAYSD